MTDSETITVTKKRSGRGRRASKATPKTAPGSRMAERERPELPYVSDAQARILCAIVHLMELDELWRSPTNIEVAALTELAASTVSEHVKNLIGAGILIRPERRPWHYIVTDKGDEIIKRIGDRYRFADE